MTMSEIEEDRLLNGREYINLPENVTENRWKEMEDTAQAETNLDLLRCRQEIDKSVEELDDTQDDMSYLRKLKDSQDDAYQQVD